MSSIGCKCSRTATLRPPRAARRVVLAGRFALGSKVADQFRKMGWEVFLVSAARDIQAAAMETDPHAVLIPEAADDESGYLACAKLLQTMPELKVIVVGTERTAKRERFAEFVGAEFVTESEGLCTVANAVAC